MKRGRSNDFEEDTLGEAYYLAQGRPLMALHLAQTKKVHDAEPPAAMGFRELERRS